MKSRLKIEHGLPIPARRPGGMTEALRNMEIGDSVFLQGAAIAKVASTCAAAARRIGSGIKFSCRTVDGGVRVWRIA